MPAKNLSITVQFESAVAKKRAGALAKWLERSCTTAGTAFGKSRMGDLGK